MTQTQDQPETLPLTVERKPPTPNHKISGDFAPGNSASKTNAKTAKHMMAWKKARNDAITVEDISAVIKALFKRAIAGEQWACELVIKARFIPAMPEDTSSQSGAAPVQIQVIMPGALHRQMMEIGRTTPPVPGLGLLPDIEGEPDASE